MTGWSDEQRSSPVPRPERMRARDAYRDHETTRWFMQHVREVVGTADLRQAGSESFRLPRDERDLDTLTIRVAQGGGGVQGHSLFQLLRRSETDAFLVLHHGAIVYERYFNGMTPQSTHMWQSMSKSLVGCLAGILIAEGRLQPDERVGAYVPELDGSAYGDACVRHLLDMQVGVEYSEDYTDPEAAVNELDRLYGVRPARSRRHPGSTYDFAAGRSKRGEHGTAFDYVSLNVNVLAWVLETVSGAWLPDLIRDRIWGKLGAEHDAYMALDGAGNAAAESGVCSSLRDLARLGLALSKFGKLGGREVLPAAWIHDIVEGGDQQAFAAAKEDSVLKPGSYRDNFWVTRSGKEAAFLALGIYGQTLYVDPAAEVVVAKFSTQAEADDTEAFRMEFTLCETLAECL